MALPAVVTGYVLREVAGRGGPFDVAAMAASRRTAWHYFLHLLLMERGSRRFTYTAEFPVTEAVQRMDWLVVRRREEVVADDGTTLVALWPLLSDVNVLEYKSASRGYRPRELYRLLGYGLQYVSADAGPLPPDTVTLVLLVASRNATLAHDEAALGMTSVEVAPGYAWLRGAPLPVLRVDLTAVARAWHDELLALFAADVPLTPAAGRWWYAHHGPMENEMNPTELEDFDEMHRRYIASLPPELRIAGLSADEVLSHYKADEVLSHYKADEVLSHYKAEEVLSRYKPDDLARALSESDRVLALPDAALAAFPESYLSTLPTETQRRIRERLGR